MEAQRLFPLPVLHPLSREEEGSADEYRCQGEVLKVSFCFWKIFTYIHNHSIPNSLRKKTVLQCLSSFAPHSYLPFHIFHHTAKPYSRETSRPNALDFNQSRTTRTRLRAGSWSAMRHIRKGCLTAEAHAQVRTSPEQICQTTPRGKVAIQPAHISYRSLTSDISQGALVSVVEWLDVFYSSQLPLMGFDFLCNFCRISRL